MEMETRAESNSAPPVADTSTDARSNLWKAIGPGILVACAAVGGSHLVWSTRAGAEFGWSLLGLILLANLFKYPFLLYGQRYTAATGESLLSGYNGNVQHFQLRRRRGGASCVRPHGNCVR